MAYKTFESRESLLTHEHDAENKPLHLNAQDGQSLNLPDADFIKNSEIIRDGSDLRLESNGETVIVDNYFAQNNPPNLIAPDGSVLSPKLVESFARSDAEFAQAEGKNDASPIGAVREIKGEATVKRADGTVETLGIGSPIYAGDIIETDTEGAVNIIFMDETTFAVSGDTKLAIDEYVFDPSTQSGESNFSVLKGMFVFTSGLIGRDDPDDVQINTPAGSIGIRGTIIAGNVDSGEITVIEGAIVLQDFSGNTITLSDQYETARFNTSGGAIEHIGNLSPNDVGTKFSGISSVAGDLFSTIQDKATEQQKSSPANTQPGENLNTGAEEKSPPAPQDGEDHSNLAPLQNFITSGEIVSAGTEFKFLQPLNNLQQLADNNMQTGNLPPLPQLPSADLQMLKPILMLDNTDRPPFTVTITKTAFSENANTGSVIALVKGHFTPETNISLTGVSNNFYAATKIDENTYEIRLKAGMTIDKEHSIPLLFTATNASGAAVTNHIVPLNVLNIDEPTVLTNAAPNTLFAGSNGNVWEYNFANEFKDPEGDIAYYTYGISGLPGGTTDNSSSQSSLLQITMGTITADGSGTINVYAHDADGSVLNSTSKTFNFYLEGTPMSGGTDMFFGPDVATATGNTAEDVTLLGNNARIFTAGGDDQISTATGNGNTVHAGDGNDTMSISSGSGHVMFGEAGNDTFNINSTNNETYGGAGSDTFVLNSASLLTGGTTVVIDGNEGLIDTLRFTGTGNINFTTINNNFVKNIENLSTINGVANNITLSRSDVIAMTDENKTLAISMDANDTLTFVNDSGGTYAFYQIGSTAGREIYSDGLVTLLVSDTGTNNGIA